jgi:predicted alpha/beta superfamily hydrolase
MRILIFLFLLMFSYVTLSAQTDGKVVVGLIDSIESTILKEKRIIWVHVPEEYDMENPSDTKYPVVYLLDGGGHFYSVVGMMRQLSTINGNTVCPKMIVVAILNTNRTRDLTPTKPTKPHPFADSSMIAASGGGMEFLSFIENELIPHVDEKYPTEDYKMFIGHSLGGLMVMQSLLAKPELFNSYVAIDPSMWWNSGRLLNEIKTTTFDARYENKSLYLGIANTLPDGMDVDQAKVDKSLMTEHFRKIMELNEFLESDGSGQLAFGSKYYADDTHGSVPLISEYDALRFIFDFYQLKIEPQDYMNPQSDLVSKIENHYKKLSEYFGVEKLPEEGYINGMGYEFMRMKQYKKSEDFFKLNVSNYPESFNVYDSLGDLYAAMGEKEKAIMQFKKSLSLNPESYSKDKLKKLMEE